MNPMSDIVNYCLETCEKVIFYTGYTKVVATSDHRETLEQHKNSHICSASTMSEFKMITHRES